MFSFPFQHEKKGNLFTYLFQSMHLFSMKHEFYLPKSSEDFAALERVSCIFFNVKTCGKSELPSFVLILSMWLLYTVYLYV